MSKVVRKYVEIAKLKLDVASDSKVAEKIGITRSGLSKILKGGPASQDTLGKLARVCGKKPELLIAEWEMERPHTPEIKSMWERIAGTAAVWALMGMSTLLVTAERAGLVYILC